MISRRTAVALMAAPAVLRSQSNPRFAIAGFAHETNSFAPTPTAREDFESEIRRGTEVIPYAEKSNTTIAGFIAGCREHGLEMHPIVDAKATPAGLVTPDAFETYTGEILEGLKKAPKLNGVLLSLHGAMVTAKYPHADAEVVRRVREQMGPDFLIGVTHDFHANVSDEIVRDSTALNTYKLCPHLDPKERGIQIAGILGMAARGKAKPVQALVKPPMIYNLIYHDTDRDPFRRFVAASRELEKNRKVLAASVPGGYQWADVPAIGPSAVVITDNDPELAKREAARLSNMLWETRDRIKLNLPTVPQAVKMAQESDKFPVALIDTGDNIGGGSAGDSTFLLEELLKQKATGWVVVIADPEAVSKAFAAGIGGDFDMPVGGKIDTLHGKPVRVKGKVKLFSDGTYVEPEVRHGGARYWHMGRTAVIHQEGGTIDMPNILVVTAERSSPNSIHQLTSNGIYPERMRILTVKGCIAPRAAYVPVAARIIEVDTGGVCAVNPARFTFKNVRPNLFGLT